MQCVLLKRIINARGGERTRPRTVLDTIATVTGSMRLSEIAGVWTVASTDIPMHWTTIIALESVRNSRLHGATNMPVGQ